MDILNCNSCGIKPRAKGRKICEGCKSRAYRSNNRANCIWHWIKKSAKKRRIHFDLSKDFLFKKLEDSGYLNNRGFSAEDMTVDRIVPELGYIDSNIQIITRSQNSIKYHAEEKEEYPF